VALIELRSYVRFRRFTKLALRTRKRAKSSSITKEALVVDQEAGSNDSLGANRPFDLADLIATNANNQTNGKFPQGKVELNGSVWEAVRIVGVDYRRIKSTLELKDDELRVDLRTDVRVVQWGYLDMAAPIQNCHRTAQLAAVHYLEKCQPQFLLDGFVVWLGARRYWIDVMSESIGKVNIREATEFTPKGGN
jgi:hypothetical protein